MIERGFMIEHKDKQYFFHFLNADYPVLFNRDYIEITDEENEEADLTPEEEKEMLDLIAENFWNEDVKELVLRGLKAHGISEAHL